MAPHRDFEYISSLIVKFLKNELTDQEGQELDAWLAESAANVALLESFKDSDQARHDINFIQHINVNEEWKNFQYQVVPQGKNWIKRWLPHAAAIFIIASALGMYLFQDQQANGPVAQNLAFDVAPGSKRAFLELSNGNVVNLDHKIATKNSPNGFNVKEGIIYFTSNHSKFAKNNFNALRTPKAGEYKLVLPDGTQVWLNASSYLRFPENFDGAERRVELKGEAYFEVAHLPSKPFVVAFNDTEVRVLGTHFNVNTYGKTSTTTLLEGSVKISDGSSEKMLKPGQEAFVDAGEISVQKTEVYKSIAWKEGIFYFKEDGIKEVLSQIARWYDIEIAYQGTPTTQTITGNIRRQASLNQVLEMLSTVTHAKFNLKDKIVTVNFNP